MPELSRLGLFVGASLALLMIPGPAVLYIVTRSVEQGRRAGLVSVLGICSGTLVHVVAAAFGLSALLVSSALAFSFVRFLGAGYLIVLGVQTLLKPAAASADIVPAARGESLASHRDGRGAPPARRDDREYREYLRKEQRSRRGCIARRTGSPARQPRWGPRMQPDFHRGLLKPAALRRVFTQGVIVNLLNPHTALFFFAFLPQFVNPASGHVPLQLITLGLLFVGLSAITDSGWAIAAGTAGNWIKKHRRLNRGQRYVTGGALIGLGAATAFAGSGQK